MELRDYIDMAAEKAGGITALSKILDMTQPTVSNIRAHRKSLPDVALVTLAEYLQIPEKELIAANNIAMGKHVEFWRPFVEHAKAASIALTLGMSLNFVTPSPAEAGQTVMTSGNVLYYVKYNQR